MLRDDLVKGLGDHRPGEPLLEPNDAVRTSSWS